MMDILDLIEEEMTKPWVWGECDCCLAAGAVFARFHQIEDPLARFRGTYRTRQEAVKVLRPLGGVLGAVAGEAGRLGLTPALIKVGSVGVLRMGPKPFSHRTVAVNVGGAWVGKTINGYSFVSDKYLLRCWGVQ